MKRLSLVALAFAFAASMAVAPGCQKAEEAKPEVTTAPKPVEKPVVKPAPKPAQETGSQIEKETLDSCLKRNPDNAAYCRCYANEVGTRYGNKAKDGDVSVQDRGQIAVQAALSCKKLNKNLKK